MECGQFFQLVFDKEKVDKVLNFREEQAKKVGADTSKGNIFFFLGEQLLLCWDSFFLFFWLVLFFIDCFLFGSFHSWSSLNVSFCSSVSLSIKNPAHFTKHYLFLVFYFFLPNNATL
jgi:hypothetical protein